MIVHVKVSIHILQFKLVTAVSYESLITQSRQPNLLSEDYLLQHMCKYY